MNFETSQWVNCEPLEEWKAREYSMQKKYRMTELNHIFLLLAFMFIV